jgi:hypothetical protein
MVNAAIKLMVWPDISNNTFVSIVYDDNQFCRQKRESSRSQGGDEGRNDKIACGNRNRTFTILEFPDDITSAVADIFPRKVNVGHGVAN